MARQILTKWLDYSAGKLTGAAVKAAGYTGVVRYIDDITNPELVRTKHTNLAEYRSMLAAGVAVMLVMEVSTSDADGGYARGALFAQRAKAGADALGYTGLIFFCNDRPELPNAGLWTAYLDGAASVLGRARVGAYGFASALNAAQGHASAFWQAGRQSDLVDHAFLYQWNNGATLVSGIECDINYFYGPMPGQSGASSGGGSAAPADQEVEDVSSDVVIGAGTGATDPYVELHIPVNGHRYLRLSSAYGRIAHFSGISLVDDTPAGNGPGNNVKTVQANSNIDPDRPGPWDLAATDSAYANYSHVVVQLKAPVGGKVKGWINDLP